MDLIHELNQELDKENLDKGLVKDLLKDITQNEERITNHVKRASNIVKGMLEHSRNTTGERVLTDINQLADEYLRLSFHGMKAKDKTFNVDYQLIADENLPKIAIVPQEIGRVILNLINNAFYSVGQLERHSPSRLSKKIIVTTKTLENQIEISVKDNGNGIPDNIKEKIFQPFFTRIGGPNQTHRRRHGFGAFFEL